MSTNPFNHIDLRVANLDAALPFYQKPMPALGFTHTGSHKEPSGIAWEVFVLDDSRPSLFFALTEDRNHAPNRNCIAFFVESREEVDRIAQIVSEAGGQNTDDPSENRLEAVNWKL